MTLKRKFKLWKWAQCPIIVTNNQHNLLQMGPFLNCFPLIVKERNELK